MARPHEFKILERLVSKTRAWVPADYENRPSLIQELNGIINSPKFTHPETFSGSVNEHAKAAFGEISRAVSRRLPSLEDPNKPAPSWAVGVSRLFRHAAPLVGF
jgi:hypothetical protein